MGARSKWPLPATPSPAGDRCFLVKVPDDPIHVAAFRGALYELTKPYDWYDDDDHTALVVGARWLTNWLGIEEIDCMLGLQIEASPSGCGIRWRFGDSDWTEIDLSGCIASIALDQITTGIEDGVIQQPGGQPSPDSAPPEGECTTIHVTLPGTGRWFCPIPIKTGDTIQVKNGSGGWYDGFASIPGQPFGFGSWNCANGRHYGLGECADNDLWQEGDPYEGGNHMMVVGQNSAEWFDPWTVYTVPAGISDESFSLQANDSDTTDNQGQVEFDVEICVGFVTFSHTFDFTTGDGDFEALTNAGMSPQNEALYSAGDGWIVQVSQGVQYPQNSWAQVYIKRSLESRTLTKINFTYERTAGNSASNEGGAALPRVWIKGNAAQLNHHDGVADTGTYEWTGTAEDVTEITLMLEAGFRGSTPAVNSTGRIISATIEGRGVDPF